MVKPAASNAAPQRFAPGPVALLLFSDVRLIAEGGHHGGLHGRGHHHSRVLADGEQRLHQRGVTGHEASPVPGEIRPLGQRVNGDTPSSVPSQMDRIEIGSDSQPSSR
jgi:hypothetical protein